MDIMPRSVPRAYSRHCREAAVLLGSLIRTARKERGLAAREVAERAGISRGLLRRIENKDNPLRATPIPISRRRNRDPDEAIRKS
jgi:transcriptional regulator with XRE-family HTH domain